MNRTNSRLLTCAAVVLFALSGCKDKVNSSNYEAVTMGMSLQEIENILGPGEKQEITGVSISGAGVGGASTGSSQLTFVWKKNGKEISVIFQDGKAVSKNQFGL